MKKIILFFLLAAFSPVFAQIQDNFSDNDFSSNPTWLGDDSVFVVADDGGNLKLRSNKIIASSTFYLSSANSLSTNTQWEFALRLAYNTSSTNFVDMYLTADQSNLLAANLNGYFVRIGGTSDEISLYKNVNGSITKIIDGIDGATNVSNNNLKIKVICSATNDWTLERDNSGTGNSYTLEGTINDNTVSGSSFFGIKITQSTASFFQKHFLDDVYVGPIILDVAAPTIVSATVLDASTIDVLFSENVEQVSAENEVNYSLPSYTISSATRDAVNLSLVHLTLASPLANGTTNTLTITGVSDLFSNAIVSESVNVSLLVSDIPAKGDVIITEFYADPSPKIGLPSVEYVEIYNKSTKIFNLNGWKLADNSSAGTISDAWILPGEYKILCSSSAVDSFPNPISVTSFPSQNNSGDNVVLRYSDNTTIIDSVVWADTWYKDEIKKDGGYSLELINLNDPCSDFNNWSASNAIIGGTPGAQNSIFDANPDITAPTILEITAIEPNYLSVTFNEGMDSTSLENAGIVAGPGLSLTNIYVTNEFTNNALIEFNEDFVGSQIYTIAIQNVADCWNNSTTINTTFTLPEEATVGDIIINEILSDPITGGYDFVELFNKSNKLINLNNYQLANFDNDSIANNKTIEVNYILYPNDYVVITQDSTSLKQIYANAVSGKFIQMSLPTYSNDSSTVFLVKQFTTLDKVSYEDDWHFALLDDQDGKSLERIDPNGKSNDKNNWHTASSVSGYATPGKINSQLMYGEDLGEITLTNSIFSPDNDGFEDVLQINYQMINAGKLASISIYDDKGRVIKKLVTSEIIGNEGTFNWDGVTENNQKASIGAYVLLFEAFDTNGGTILKKLPFVVAGKL